MSKKLFYTITALLLLTVISISACTAMIPRTGPNPIPMDATQVYQAALATATQIAIETQISQLQTQVAQGGQGQPTNAPVEVTQVPGQNPTETPVPPTATAVPPTATPVPPTATPIPPTATPLPTATNTPIPCNLAQFVGDVTIPDNTAVVPGQTFTKTWRLKNTGSCTWTTAYSLVFFNGDRMSADPVVALPGNVVPGQVIDVSARLIAPNDEGTFRGNWKLRDASNVLFGVGATSDPFYVVVKVYNPVSRYPLDFVATYCTADWTTGAGRLNCPSPDRDSRGFVLRVDNPVLESGYKDDEPALVTYPQMINDGVIRGKFPEYKVDTGDHFRAIIGCARDAKSCNVKFQLDYQVGDGSIQTLKTWHEVYDEEFTSVDVDLKNLVGKRVKFILTVLSNGSSTDDRALWLSPRVEH